MTENDETLSDIDTFRLHYHDVSRSMTKINRLDYDIRDREQSYRVLIVGIIVNTLSVIVISSWWWVAILVLCSVTGLMIGTFFMATSSIELRDVNEYIREAREIISDPSRLKKAVMMIDRILNKPILDDSIRSYFATIALTREISTCEIMKNAMDWLKEATQFIVALEERTGVD